MYLLHPHLRSLLVTILQLHLPMSLTQEGFRKGQLLSARLILTLLQRGLPSAARMFVIYMLLCVHMEMQGLLYLKKLKSVYAHNHVFLHYLKNVDRHVINDLCSLSCFFYVCSMVIISFWSFYVTLDHLALSVKPGGKLMSPIAEIAIYTIDDTSTKTIKRVLPLRVSVSSYFSSIILLL